MRCRVNQHLQPRWRVAPNEVVNRMQLLRPWTSVRNYYKRKSAYAVFRKPINISTPQPLISFTFDDFPRTALVAGGAILNRYGASGTYYVSLGILGEDSPSGPLCTSDDLVQLREQRHELGCHTFSHCNSWDTESTVFEHSIIQNRDALKGLFPDAEFKSFSYPMSEPHPITKLKTGRHFQCCRAGGQTLNLGTADLNQLSAYFLEKSRNRIQDVKDIIDLNHQKNGWIIFATHDIRRQPGPYGCVPEFFEEVVRYASSRGRVLPVDKALEALRS
jgi:peptidoglycan/xylan/chitin deacetylase (PgdA/CDA1 family)